MPQKCGQAEANDKKSQMAQTLSGGRVSTQEQRDTSGLGIEWGEYITPRNVLSIIGLGRTLENIFNTPIYRLIGIKLVNKLRMECDFCAGNCAKITSGDSLAGLFHNTEIGVLCEENFSFEQRQSSTKI